MTHEEKLQQIELETAEIKRQMMNFEFQQKKEEAERKNEIDALRKESEKRWARIEKQNEFANKKIQYLIDATGVIFDEITQIDTNQILERNR